MRAKIYPKGQITLPVRFRKELGLAPGDEVEILLEENRLIVVPLLAPGSEVPSWRSPRPEAPSFSGPKHVEGAPSKERRRELVREAAMGRLFKRFKP